MDYGLRAEVDRSLVQVQRCRKSKDLFNCEDLMMEMMKERYKICYNQIHLVLAKQRTEAAEREIKKIIKDIYQWDLPVCFAKYVRCKRGVEICNNKGDKEGAKAIDKLCDFWAVLRRKFFALVAFRSLEHWALFSEYDKIDNDKFWEYSIDTFGDNGYSGCTKGFFYYGNKMVLDNKIKFILKQMPTAFGKSFSDSIMISFIFGVDRKEQIIKVVGNRSLAPKCTRQVVELMCSKAFREVFPEYADIDDGKDVASQIFSTCSIKDGLLTINGCGRDTSFECFSKDCNRDGIRGGYLFLDDVVQRSERMKLKIHTADIESFDGTWKKRSRDEKTFRIVCGGTTYDPYDLLETLRFRYSKGKVKKSPVNKYTTLSMDEDAAFIKVPKLDEKDQLTFPQKTVLANVLADRKNNPELFAAMDMQEPVAPDDTPFYWNFIKQYEFIPDNKSEYCLASLDPARTGDNYVSMPIFRVVKEFEKDGTEVESHYLVDCLYKKAPMDVVYGQICELVEKHHIIKLHIERNTDTSLKFLLDKMLKERGIFFCEISEVYSTKNKEDRIYANETLIKNKIKFPFREMYGRASEMGQFLEHIISYKYKGAEYDDSIDAVGLYVDKFINTKRARNTVRLLAV